jgi:conjugal transfer/entry exclusion protein
MRRVLTLTLVLYLSVGTQFGYAQWAVHDAPSFARDAAQWIEEAIQWATSIGNQVKEIEATYNVIYQEIEQYKLMILNLERLPEQFNVFDVVTSLGNQITGLFKGATMVSYNLGQVVSQFDAMYERIGTLATPAEVFTLRQKWLAGRNEASKVTVQVTAIQSNLSELYQRLCSLLTAAQQSRGNLEIQQVQSQQLGLVQHTLSTQAAMAATHARLIAQQQAEDAALERVKMEAWEGAIKQIDHSGYTPQVRPPSFGFQQR